MSDAESFWQVLKTVVDNAIAFEFYTPTGQINLIFGIIATALVALFMAGKGVESIGDFVLRLLRRKGRARTNKDGLIAIVSLTLFFLFSLLFASLDSSGPAT